MKDKRKNPGIMARLEREGWRLLKKECAKLERENAFYREQLRTIANHKRHTIEQRLAASALTFWDEIKSEALVAGKSEK